MRFHALCALYIAVALAGCSQTLSQISNENGLQRIQSPPKVLEPGTLITFEESGAGLTAITPVCWRHQAFKLLRPVRSVPGVELNLKRQLGDWQNLEPAYLQNLQTKFPKVDDIELRLRNVSVVENTATELYKGLPTRTQSCQDAVAVRQANGETVYTILRVFKADVTYKIIGVDRSRLKGKLPQVILERLKTELGGSSFSTFEQIIKGKALPVAFQFDIIGMVAQPSSAEVENVPNMDGESMAFTDSKAVVPQPKEMSSVEEATSAPSTAVEASSDADSEEVSRISRLTTVQHQLIIKKMGILSTGHSDADRRKK